MNCDIPETTASNTGWGLPFGEFFDRFEPELRKRLAYFSHTLAASGRGGAAADRHLAV